MEITGDWVIMNFEILDAHANRLIAKKADTVIVDEAHELRNRRSKRSGLDPAAGYLHHPKDQRTSLSYDALELLRADIDTRILSLLASRIWQRDDFLVPPHGIVRLTPNLARTVTGRALATKTDLTKVCDWMTRTIMAA